jgi:hypothetical protein
VLGEGRAESETVGPHQLRRLVAHAYAEVEHADFVGVDDLQLRGES